MTLVSALGVASVPASARADTPPTIPVRSFPNEAGMTLVAWEPSPGAIGVAFQAATADTHVITDRTITVWSEGHRTSSMHYRFEGLETALRIRFGISKAELESGLREGTVAEIPSPFYPGGWSSSFIGVDDFGTHVAALAKVSPVPFRYAGPAVLGLRLADASVIRVYRDTGFVVHLIYSSNPAKLGLGDRELTLDFATERSAWGSSYRSFFLRGGPKIAAGGIVAVQVNEAQIVFRIGRVFGLAFARTPITVAGWKTLLRSLRPPLSNGQVAGASFGATSPTARVDAIVKMWRANLQSGALAADPKHHFANPSQATLTSRLRLAASRYHFTVVKVEILHPRQAAPLVVVEACDKHALAASTRAILRLIDPKAPTNDDRTGWAYEGFLFEARDSHGVPFFATFNWWRGPHAGGSQWASDPSLYPLAHG